MHERLQQAFQEGRLLPPKPSALSIVDAVNAIAQLAGVTPPNPTPAAAELADQIGGAEHLMVIVVPGLADEDVLSLPDDALLKRQRRRKLRHVCPTGTTTLIATLATGLWPAQHGVFGRYGYLSERQRFVDVLNFEDATTGEDLKQAGIVPTRIFRELPLWVDAQAEPVTYVSEADRDTVWAAYLSGYRTLRRCDGFLDAVQQHVERVDGADGPTIGLAVLEPHADADELNKHLEQAVAAKGDRALKLIVIGGGAAVKTMPLSELGPQVDEAGLLAGVVGEPRMPMVIDAQERIDADAVQRVFGEGFAVISAEVAVDAGYFGPDVLTPFAEKRLPDWVAIPIDAVSVGAAEASGGGMTPREVLLPLVVI